MKVLIIGSKGFIGSHCVSYFSAKGDVWECDVVTDYDNENYFIVDATQADYSQCFKEQHYDLCINCSGAASVPDSVKYPQRDFALNVANVYKMLDAIRTYNPTCKFINLGSAAVYGNPDALPVKEDQTVHPVSPYGHHKLMAESICQEFYQFFDVPTCSVRIFSAYGPGLKKQLFWDLYKKSLGAKEVTLFGTGNETRDFIYVEDLVKVLEGIYQKGSFKGDAINIGRGIETPIKDAVSIFYECLKYTGIVSYKGENRVGDPLHWVADISKIKAMNVHPQEDLNMGIRKYVAWLEENA